MGPLGLEHVSKEHDDQFFYYANVRFARTQPYYPIGYITSETALARLASLLARWTDKAGGFDIRTLGSVHAVVLLIGIAIALDPRLRLPRAVSLLLAIAALLIFCDVAYVAPMNSFYSAPASFLGLILVAGLLLQGTRRERPSAALLAAFWIAAFGFVLSKPQESVIAPIVAALGLRWSWTFFDRRWRRQAAAAAGLLFAAAVAQYALVPADYNDASVFHSIFLEMLPNSPDRQGDLEALGLPGSWSRYSGMSAYRSDSPFNDSGFRRRLVDRVGHARIALFYAQRPARLLKLLGRAAAYATVMRPGHLGNFEKSVGLPPRAKSHAFAIWSGWKARLARWGPLLLVGNLLAGIAIAIVSIARADRGRDRFAGEAVLALVAVTALEFLVAVTGEGITDVIRHLFAFHALFDLLLVVNAGVFLAFVQRRAVSSIRTASGTRIAIEQ